MRPPLTSAGRGGGEVESGRRTLELGSRGCRREFGGRNEKEERDEETRDCMIIWGIVRGKVESGGGKES